MRCSNDLKQLLNFIDDAITPDRDRLNEDNNYGCLILVKDGDRHKFMQEKLLFLLDKNRINDIRMTTNGDLIDRIDIKNSYGGTTYMVIKNIVEEK